MSNKIILLAMCCNQPFFRKQAEFLLKESYGKDIISGKYPNVDFFIYTASENGSSYIDYENHMIYVNADDTLEGTFEKTQNTLKLLNDKGVDYEWIMHTNCSSWINVPLLSHFISSMKNCDRNKIFSSRIYSSIDGCGPDLFDFYGVGNGLLIPKFWCNIIANTVLDDIKKYNKVASPSIYKIDDNAIGFICNTYAESNKMNKYSIWKSYRDVYTYGKITPYTFHSKNFLNFIVIPIRIYDRDREEEYAFHRMLLDEIIDINFDNVNVYDILTENDKVLLVDFSKGLARIVTHDDAVRFAVNPGIFDNNIEKYCFYINQNAKKQV